MVTKTTTAKKAIANKPAAKKTPVKKLTPVTKQLDSVAKAAKDFAEHNAVQNKINEFAKKIVSALDTAYRARRSSRTEISVSTKDLSTFLGTGKNLVKNFFQLSECIDELVVEKNSKFSEYFVDPSKTVIYVEKYNTLVVKLKASDVIEEIKPANKA